MLTYKEMKNEKIILQKMQKDPYTHSAKVLFSMVVTAILVGIPTMIVAFFVSIGKRIIDAKLGIIERFGVHPMRMEKLRIDNEHQQKMAALEYTHNEGIASIQALTNHPRRGLSKSGTVRIRKSIQNK